MTIGETVRKAIKEISDGVLDMISPKSFKLTDDEELGLYVGLTREKNGMTPVKPKRARTAKGKYKADDKKTKNVNEAWVGGKAPKKTRKKTTRKKK